VPAPLPISSNDRRSASPPNTQKTW
jgi:hypothetical protein